MIRSSIVMGAGLLAALAAGGAMRAAIAQTHSTGSGQAYPSGPLRIVVPYPPGGGTDILGRTIGQKLNERFGVPVVIDTHIVADGASCRHQVQGGTA